MSEPSAGKSRPVPADRATSLTRRTFLAGLTAAGGAAVWRFLFQPLLFGNPADGLETLLLQTVSLLPAEIAPADQILAQRPGTSRADLLEALIERIQRATPAPPSHENELFRLFSRLVREDYAAGRMVEIRSRQWTDFEVSLAALRSLPDSVGQTSPAEFQSATRLCDVSDWGPQSTPSSVPFNEQPDGSSALWLQAQGAPADASVWLGNHPLRTNVEPNLVTAGLPARVSEKFLEKTGSHAVRVVTRDGKSAQLVGYFHIVPEDRSRSFAAAALDLSTRFQAAHLVETIDWGPRKTRVGEPFNRQPDGRSALWLRFAGDLPEGSFLTIADLPLLTTAGNQGVITAGIVPALTLRLTAMSGTLPLHLVHPGSLRAQAIGNFQVVYA